VRTVRSRMLSHRIIILGLSPSLHFAAQLRRAAVSGVTQGRGWGCGLVLWLEGGVQKPCGPCTRTRS
jgi:hypothetical protein